MGTPVRVLAFTGLSPPHRRYFMAVPETHSATEQVDNVLQERVFELVRGRFRPASEADADNFYSTEQLFSMLADHEPLLAESKFGLRTCLLALEFTEHLIGDQFFWAVRNAH